MAYLITADKLVNLKIIKSIEPVRIIDYNEKDDTTYVTIEIDILIDKKNAILRDVDKIDLLITKATPQEVIQRYRQIPDTFFDVKSLTSSQINGQEDYINDNLKNANKGMLDALRNQFIDLGVIPLDSISILSKIDTSVVSKVKNNSITDEEAFGTTERYTLVQNSTDNKKILAPEQKNKANTDYLKYNRQRNHKIKSIASLTRKVKKYNDLGLNIVIDKNSGLKKFISKEKGNLSFKDRINGSHKRITSFQYAPQDIKRIISYVKSKHNNVIQRYFGIKENTSELKLEKFSNRVEPVKKLITISEDYITSNSVYTIMAITYDKNKIKKEVEFGKVNVSLLINNFRYPSFDFDFDVINEQKNNFIARISNNEKITRKYAVGLKENNKYVVDKYSQIGTIEVNPKSSGYIKFKKSKYKNYSFVANPIFNQREYSNSRFSHHRGNNQLIKSSHFDFYCENEQSGIAIYILNLNEDAFKARVYKKNISKKEKNYTYVRQKQTTALAFPRGNARFLDSDVEDKEVYEYKVEIEDMYGNKIISSNSFLEKYCRKQSVLKMTLISNEVVQSADEKKYNIVLGIDRKLSDADKLVNSLLGNYYSLFEEKIKEINAQNFLIYDFEVTAIRPSTGEQLPVGNYQLTESLDTLDINFKVPNDKFVLKISPRIALPDELITLLKKTEGLNNISDTFLNKETGDIIYIKDTFDQSQNNNAGIAIKNKKIKKIKTNERFDQSNKRLNNIEVQYDASFDIKDLNSEIDYVIMSYTINQNEVVLYDIAGIPITNTDNLGNKSFRYSYTIQDEKGINVFLAQVVLKDGNFLNPFIIGTIENKG
jgi:hypothetical protein